MNDTQALLSMVKLRFNIEHPSVEECYSFGYECADAGIGEEENPFADGTMGHDQWVDGWWAGFYGEEPIFELVDDFKKELVSDNTLESTQQFTTQAANDQSFQNSTLSKSSWLMKVLEISGVLAVSAVVGYQVLDMVA